MIRAVLDTNVLISGFINPKGPPGILSRACIDRRFILCSSVPLYEEVVNVFGRPVILRLIRVKQDVIHEFLCVLRGNCCGQQPYPEIDPSIIADPADLKVLQAALASNADYIVSGDHHLLDLRQFHGIPIVTAREFLEKLPPSE